MHVETKEPTPFKLPTDPKKEHIELFESLAAMPDSTAPLEKSLLVLATPRCGSTLFCEALNNTGQLGICEEWFNYDYFSAWAHVVGKDDFMFSDYLLWVYRKSARNTGVFTLKWHIGQLVAMNSDFKLGLEAMDFTRVVYLYRRDKIAQAVSLAKAASTNQFRSYQRANGAENMSRAAIADGLNNLIKFDHFARKYLWKYVDASYAYEDFRQLSDATPEPAHESYHDTLSALGKGDRRLWYAVERLKKQGDHRNEAAAADFRQHITGEIE